MYISIALFIRAFIAQVLSILRNVAFFFYPSRYPCPGDAKVSRYWLEKVLKRKIMSCKTVPFDGKGVVGEMAKIEVKFKDLSNEKNQNQNKSTSFLLKRSRNGISARRGVIKSEAYREGYFYRYVFNTSLFESVQKYLPFVVYSRGSWLFGEYVILMEIVKGVPSNHILGNQRWGMDGISVPEDAPDRNDTMKMIFGAAAEMQVPFWNDRSLLKINWLKTVDRKKGRGRAVWEIELSKGKKLWKKAKELSRSGKYIKFNNQFINMIEKSLEMTTWKKYKNHIKNSTFTLTHGDFHAKNIFLVRSKEKPKDWKIKVYDVSEVGVWNPVADLTHITIGDWKNEDWGGSDGKNVISALKYYHSIINEIPGNGYSWEECLSDFSRTGMERWIWLFLILAGGQYCPPKIISFFYEQMVAFRKTFGGREFYILNPSMRGLSV